MRRNKFCQLYRVNRGIRAKLYADQVTLALDCGDASVEGLQPQCGVAKQLPQRDGRVAVAVTQLGFNLGKLPLGFNPGDTLIHAKALIFFEDVVGGNADVETKVKLSLRLRFSFTFHFAHGLLKHLRVKIETDGFDVPALLASQKIACATELEIKSGDFETCAEIRKFLQRSQPAARDRSEFNVGRNQKIRVSAAVRPAYAATKLVEL